MRRYRYKLYMLSVSSSKMTKDMFTKLMKETAKEPCVDQRS